MASSWLLTVLLAAAVCPQAVALSHTNAKLNKSFHPSFAAACLECKTFAGDGGGCSAGSCSSGYCWCPKMLMPLGTGGGAGRNPPQPRETADLPSAIAASTSAQSGVNCAGYAKCPKEVVVGPS
ncbi:unnamed protein product [Prorocentrum cordatum]|uniref:Uncharacterized protein n=1 Tax=Prorocentrum cordatum TaxID=2364126 RepID=A0ABN9TKZ0_9DINO|nr:unnamed protein product [Polarella glacialis]